MDHLLQWITNFDYRLRDTAARARHHLQIMPVSEVVFYSPSLFELFESFPSLPLFFFRALLRAPALSPELSSSGQSHGVCRRATAGTGLDKRFPASFSSLLHALQIATCLKSSNISANELVSLAALPVPHPQALPKGRPLRPLGGPLGYSCIKARPSFSRKRRSSTTSLTEH